MSMNDTCYIRCSECKGKNVTMDKPRTVYDFTCTEDEWSNNPVLVCPKCRMKKTVIVNKPKKHFDRYGKKVMVDNYVPIAGRGLMMVAIEATPTQTLRY